MRTPRSFPHEAHGQQVGELPLVLRVLDHQVVGADEEMIGKVEDLVLEPRGDEMVVVGMVLGTAGWAGRQRGRLGGWVESVWRRLDRDEHPRPTTLSLAHVVHLDSAVHVDEVAAASVAAASDLERWLRRHLVAPIPGSGVDGDDDPDPGSSTPVRGTIADAPLDEGGRLRLSDIVHTRVEDGGGNDLGRVTEVHAALAMAVDGTPELRLVSLTHGRHLLGNGLGYRDQSHAGPAVLARLVRWWHRHECVTRWDDVVTIPGSGQRQEPIRADRPT